MYSRWLSFALSLLVSAPLFALGFKAQVGATLPEVSITGEHGGLVADGNAWDSKSLRGKLQFLLYIDPDQHTLNDELIDRMEAEHFPRTELGSAAIINLAASWKPNSLIMPILRSKQKRFPATVYVFDKDRSIAKEWGLAADGYHVVLLDQDSKILFEKDGKLDKQEVENFISLLRSKIQTLSSSSEEAGKEKKKSL